ncbi:DsbC family protein [Sphingomonas sp. 2R-10]|uniref:DsbC family protein n=1 Tax=Sphingomonas sp. 2R-10 TaxID=3045148 RepID=UPI000F7B76C7|nr:DsbC family protein [Sphingomonas sp. 2R-10]MDJ0277713.1 DsbC family protein [Sphingomonas sp. 2R-10]
MSRRALRRLTASLPFLALISLALPANAQSAPASPTDVARQAEAAQRQLQQTFTNLQFEDFGPSPVEGPIYQANAGGRIVYYAPRSEHLLFAAVYDRNGVNVTALAQETAATKRLKRIDPSKALAIGPVGAPTVIEFTDPDCPYCRALDRFWAARAAEGKPVRRLVFFVSDIHPDAAAKAEHILCSPDPAATFEKIYAGASPKVLATCAAGKAKVAVHAATVAQLGIGGTPTIIADGKIVSGFRQDELEAFLNKAAGSGR